jgi:peptidoglycan/xylan/chitin deacetylase (PgdA/CDA1 family)
LNDMNERLIRNFIKLTAAVFLYYSGVLYLFLRFVSRNGLYVFNYHGFNTFVNDYWKSGSLFRSNYKRNFERQILFYNKHFQRSRDFSLKRNLLGERSYLLTFDDGYKDNFDIALPILKKYEVPAIFLVTTGCIGSDGLLWHDRVRLFYEMKERKGIYRAAKVKKQCKKALGELKKASPEKGTEYFKSLESAGQKHPRLMMTWEEVRQAHKQGIMIGPHTHSHPILAGLNEDQQREEIGRSVEAIKKNLGFSPRFFSYPEGGKQSYGDATIRALKQARIEVAFTIENGINSEDTPPYLLKRVGICPSDPVALVALKVAFACLKESKLRSAVKGTRAMLSEYGAYNFLKRMTKRTIRVLGVRLETYYLLHRSLNGEIKGHKAKSEVEVIDLTLKDLEESRLFYTYPPLKREIFRKRFSNRDYQPFGVKVNGRLVYVTWTQTDHVNIEAIGFRKKLNGGEAALVDSYALPEARGLGLHTFMNGHRLNKLREKGVGKAYVAVLAENRPALKTQLKYGFTQGERLTWFKWGRLERRSTKEISFS